MTSALQMLGSLSSSAHHLKSVKQMSSKYQVLETEHETDKAVLGVNRDVVSLMFRQV